MQTAKTLISLGWVFAGRTCHFDGFATRRLILLLLHVHKMIRFIPYYIEWLFGMWTCASLFSDQEDLFQLCFCMLIRPNIWRRQTNFRSSMFHCKTTGLFLLCHIKIHCYYRRIQYRYCSDKWMPNHLQSIFYLQFVSMSAFRRGLSPTLMFDRRSKWRRKKKWKRLTGFMILIAFSEMFHCLIILRVLNSNITRHSVKHNKLKYKSDQI